MTEPQPRMPHTDDLARRLAEVEPPAPTPPSTMPVVVALVAALVIGFAVFGLVLMAP